MKVQHVLIGLFTTVLWGLNFVVSKIALHDLPPIFFTTLRFAALLPLLLIVPKPKVPARLIVGLGMTWGVLQFTFLHIGLTLGVPAGVSSLVMQTSAFFGVLFAWALLGERVTLLSLAGLAVGFAGIAVLGWDGGNQSAPLSGLLLTLFASASWSFGNILLKKMKEKDKNNAGIIVWSCAVPVLPLLLLSLWWEGEAAIIDALRHFSLLDAGCVFYAGVVATLLGGTLWAGLLQQYEATRVLPLSLFVPLWGVLAASLWLGEPLSWRLLIAAGLLVVGYLLNHKGKVKVSRTVKEPLGETLRGKSKRKRGACFYDYS